MDENKKKVIEELISFFAVFQKEVLDEFPEDILKISPLLSKAMREIYYAEDITSSVLSRRLSITVPNTSRCLQRLSALSYIIRVKDKQDRRITHIKLTEKGKLLVEKSIRYMDELMLKKLTMLEPYEIDRLSEALATIKELFHKMGQAG